MPDEAETELNTEEADEWKSDGMGSDDSSIGPVHAGTRHSAHPGWIIELRDVSPPLEAPTQLLEDVMATIDQLWDIGVDRITGLINNVSVHLLI
jgi:hypothetical protein